MTNRSPSRDNYRIRWLVIAHLILAAGPVVHPFGRPNVLTQSALTLQWALQSIPFGGLMTLSIWLGMGSASISRRIALALISSFFVAVIQLLSTTELSAGMWNKEWLVACLEETLPMSIFVLVCGGIFFSLRRWYTLKRIDPADRPQKSERLQFSMLQIMLTISGVAVLLSLQRSATAAADANDQSFWLTFGTYAFVFGIFLLNTVCAALAVLSAGRIGRNICLTFFISGLLGLAIAFGWQHDDTPSWLFLNYILIPIFPTAVVVVSLLVVRSAGYRLVKQAALQSAGDSAAQASA